ncbi:MAG: 4Fe-4S binding protein, partial [Thermoproteota archaeon]
MDEIKIGVFLSDDGELVSEILDFDALVEHLKKIPEVAFIAKSSAFRSSEGIKTIQESIRDRKINRVVAGVTLPKLSEVRIVQAAEKAGLNPYLVEVVDLKNHCALPHQKTPLEATEKAKAMLSAAVERAKLLEPIKKLHFPALKSALIIGGGIAGMQAAEDLADLGFKVHLIEKEPFLGGLAARAGRFFPTDDCAICIQPPTKDVPTITSTSRKCVYRSGFSEIPNLEILTNSEVKKVEGVPGNYTVTIQQNPRYVNEEKCVQCDKCYQVCPVEVLDEYNAELDTRKAIYINVPHVYPPVYAIDQEACKFQDCAQCVEVCPTDAIELDQQTEKLKLNVGAIVVATGFEELDTSVIKEYHSEDPDIITHLELARMIDGFDPTAGKIVRPSDRKPARKIVMVQCVGSRDKRWKPYCSSICCMISLKHASLIKSAYPEADITICYIDIRANGREYEGYYERAREMGVKFVKGRPTRIYRDSETDQLIVDVEDSLLNRFLDLEADLVVLAPAMVPAKGTKDLAETLGLELGEDGFFKEYNAKLRPTETKMRGMYLCGGVTFPKDAPTSSLHAHSAALKASKFLTSGEIIKDQVTAVVDDDYCGDCEFCPVTCPYGAIDLIETTEGHIVAEISDLLCEGCGICVGTCPLQAIELRHSRPDQMRAEMESLMSINGTSNPLILALCCSECGGTAVDSSGMAMVPYPANIRVMKVPCTGILQVQQFLEAFKAGAQGVMVVG